MTVKHLTSTAMQVVRTGLVAVSIVQLSVGNTFAAEFPQNHSRDNETASPIKHVIVIVGGKPQLRSRFRNLRS